MVYYLSGCVHKHRSGVQVQLSLKALICKLVDKNVVNLQFFYVRTVGIT